MRPVLVQVAVCAIYNFPEGVVLKRISPRSSRPGLLWQNGIAYEGSGGGERKQRRSTERASKRHGMRSVARNTVMTNDGASSCSQPLLLREVETTRRFNAAMRHSHYNDAVLNEERAAEEWLAWAETRIQKADPISQGVAPAPLRIAAAGAHGFRFTRTATKVSGRRQTAASLPRPPTCSAPLRFADPVSHASSPLRVAVGSPISLKQDWLMKGCSITCELLGQGKYPNPDETISSRLGRNAERGRPWTVTAARTIDALFSHWEADHCLNSIQRDEVDRP